ncbi:MAG: PASTA domain-containing protein [Clostridia bacterium]|jgi:serine/threonine-protein kinase|nr:PASTA domain-containing protein [Clostridia bacterium]
MEFKGLCLGCMNNKGDAMQCPKCGYVDGTPQVLPYLEPGTLLKEKYIVGKHLRANGEGVTYIGFDVTTNKKVTVREYLPKTLCSRVKDDDNIIIASGNKLVYQDYLQDFMEIGRALVKLSSLPSTVPVIDMFEANKTAYIVYEFVDGKPLDEIVKRARRFTWEEARPLFLPLISTVNSAHSIGLVHFGISPENIIMTRSGTLKLQGFGSPDAHLAETELTPEFYEGFSAIEQYSLERKKGKWTDVYAMCAVLFYVLTGKRPPDAVSRSYEPRLNMPADVAQNIPTHVVTALAGGLQVNIESRTHSMEELKNQLTNPVPRRPEPKPVPAAAPAAQDYGDRYVDEPSYNESSSRQPMPAASAQINRAHDYVPEDEPEISPYKYGIISGLIGFVVLGVIALICLNLIVIPMMNKNKQNEEDETSSSYVSSEEDSTGSEPTVLYRVPNLVNKKWSNVDGNEKYSNFYIRLKEEVYDENYEEGRIISQTVEAGSTVPQNTPIGVVVSKGSKMRTVPDIIGKTVSEASKELESAGLTLGDQAEEYSDDVESGKIIRLNGIEPGKKIQAGSMINVVVSLGPEE